MSLSLLNRFGLLYFLLGVVSTVSNGFAENFYFTEVRGIPFSEQKYPLTLVILICGAMFIHVGSLLLLARSFYTNPYIIVLLALIINFGFLFLVLLGSMHSPPAWTVFALWEVGLLAIVIVVAIVAGYKKLVK